MKTKTRLGPSPSTRLRPIWASPPTFIALSGSRLFRHRTSLTLTSTSKRPALAVEQSLGRDAKKRIWPVFQEYRAQLNEQGKKEYIDLLRDARGLIQSKGICLPYRAVIVDEAQDMSAEAFRLLRAIVWRGPMTFHRR